MQSAPQPYAKYRVVFQVSDNDPAKWHLALNNARNVQIDLGKESVDIEIVAYGPGLNMLKAESAVAGRVNGALDDNVAAVACDNTTHRMKLTNADLIGGISRVKAGVVRLMERQRQGWTYIRPWPCAHCGRLRGGPLMIRARQPDTSACG